MQSSIFIVLYLFSGRAKQQATSANRDRRSGSCGHVPDDALCIRERRGSAVEPRYLWNYLLLSAADQLWTGSTSRSVWDLRRLARQSRCKIWMWLFSLLNGKGSPYLITECRVLELIPVLGSQLAGDVSHKPGGRLPLLSASPQLPSEPLKGY